MPSEIPKEGFQLRAVSQQWSLQPEGCVLKGALGNTQWLPLKIWTHKCAEILNSSLSHSLLSATDRQVSTDHSTSFALRSVFGN